MLLTVTLQVVLGTFQSHSMKCDICENGEMKTRESRKIYKTVFLIYPLWDRISIPVGCDQPIKSYVQLTEYRNFAAK